jgi:hypothetical protein
MQLRSAHRYEQRGPLPRPRAQRHDQSPVDVRRGRDARIAGLAGERNERAALPVRNVGRHVSEDDPSGRLRPFTEALAGVARDTDYLPTEACDTTAPRVRSSDTSIAMRANAMSAVEKLRWSVRKHWFVSGTGTAERAACGPFGGTAVIPGTSPGMNAPPQARSHAAGAQPPRFRPVRDARNGDVLRRLKMSKAGISSCKTGTVAPQISLSRPVAYLCSRLAINV